MAPYIIPTVLACFLKHSQSRMIVENICHIFAEKTQAAYQCDWGVWSVGGTFIYFASGSLLTGFGLSLDVIPLPSIINVSGSPDCKIKYLFYISFFQRYWLRENKLLNTFCKHFLSLYTVTSPRLPSGRRCLLFTQ